MTIDNQGRITPRIMKKNKKSDIIGKEGGGTLDNLCKTIKFRSNNPKIIDLTADDQMKKN